MAHRTHRDWTPIIERAQAIVESYDTGVTLRQLFYRLVAEGLIENRQSPYDYLSRLTAARRREGGFPALVDLGRKVEHPLVFESPDHARTELARQYRRDRTEGQPVSLWLGVEKATLLGQLRSWFSPLGLPLVALRGYSSQSLVDDVRADIRSDRRNDPRKAMLIYCGDYDPSGVHIERDFALRTGTDGFDSLVRVAVTEAQIEELQLPVVEAKAGDSRVRSTGVRVQVEVEAIEPGQLRTLIQAEIDRHWDRDAYDRVLARERAERESLLP